MADPQRATNDDRFEVLQQSVQELSQIVAKFGIELAKSQGELATARKQIEALSVQVSQPVMGIKAEEPKTRQGTKNLTADGWDTTGRAN